MAHLSVVAGRRPPGLRPTAAGSAATTHTATGTGMVGSFHSPTQSNLTQTSAMISTALGMSNSNNSNNSAVSHLLSESLPPVVDSHAPSQQQNQTHGEPVRSKLESDLMENLEKMGMAAVDAAKAAKAAADQVRDGMDSPSGATNELLQRCTEPLPHRPLLLPSNESSINSPSSTQQPPRSSNLMPTASVANPQSFTTQLSMETAEADAQISQLLETLQKDPQKLVVEGEKMAEFINSLTASDDLDAVASSPIPPSTPNSDTNTMFKQQSSQLGKSSQNVPSLGGGGMPSLLQQDLAAALGGAPSPPPPSAMSNNVISKPPELTSGTTGFQASFLNSLASSSTSNNQPQELQKQTGMDSVDSLSIIGSITSPIPPSQHPSIMSNAASGTAASTLPGVQTSPQINQQNSKADSIAAISSSSVSSTAMPSIPHLVGASPVTLGGGAPSQMRAMQNLPQNTRLVRGPNGQYSLQKVHTIELIPEMQAVSHSTYIHYYYNFVLNIYFIKYDIRQGHNLHIM